jgi:alpha-mannosidase
MRYLIDQNDENWKSSHLTKGTFMDPNYSLPPNVALITLEVDQMQHKFLFLSLSLSLSLINLNVFQELDGGIVLLRLAHLYEVNI